MSRRLSHSVPLPKAHPNGGASRFAAAPSAVGRFVAISRDITLQRTEQLAEQAEIDRLKRIVGSNFDVLWEIDFSTDKVWWSDEICSPLIYAPICAKCPDDGQTMKSMPSPAGLLQDRSAMRPLSPELQSRRAGS